VAREPLPPRTNSPMKLTSLLLSAPILLALTAPLLKAAEVTVVDWTQQWDYMQPMGLDPAVADPDFNTTWFLKAADFGAYNGPAFGGATDPGDSSNTSTINHGSGPGPFGYDVIDYFTTGVPEVPSLGTMLTQPLSGNRYTSYYRTTFTASQTFTSPRIRMILDDGALIYLDGVLIARVNKADNTETYTALALDTTAGFNETGTANVNDEACVQNFSLATAGTSTQADSFVIVPVSELAAGAHTLAVSVRSNGTASSDECMGLQLKANDSGISAAASDIQRQDNGPGFADDTFTFKVKVTPVNLPGVTGWNSDNLAVNGPVTGSYAPATYTYTFPAQVDAGTLATVTIKFADASDGNFTSTLSVTAPLSTTAPPLVLSATTPSVGTAFEEPGLGLGNFRRQTFNTEIGFTSNGTVVNDAINSATGSKMLQFNAVDGLMTTEAIGLDPTVKGIKASVTVRTYTNSTTGFEFDDSLRISVEGSPDGVAWTDLGSVVPVLYGGDATTPNPAGIDQILVKLGPGTPGLPAPKSRLGWSALGYDTGTPASDTLTLPTFTLFSAEPLQMQFTHRYGFEYDGTRWDGGVVAVSVNGGPFVNIPNTSFTQNGYIGIITGNNALNSQEAFNGDSPGYLDGIMITSILTVPGVNVGDTFQLQFLGAWDEFSTGRNPSWEINNVQVKAGNTVFYSENFAAGNGGLTPSSGWLFDNGTANSGPSYYNFSRSALPVAPGDQFVRMKLSQPKHVVLSTSEFFLIDNLKLEVGLDPLADNDGDGVSNGLEDIAGTNPVDPLSAFKVADLTAPVPGNPGTWRTTLSFPAADLRVWKLQGSDDLTIWSDADVRYGDPATPSLSLFGDSATPKKFWRISIGY
jgi:hypothetical protein